MNPQTNIRLLVCDDHPLVREGLSALLAREADMEVVAEAENGVEAVALFRQHRPDVTLLDFIMPQMSGLEALTAIHAEFPKACVVILSSYDGDENIYRALQAGASGYLLKNAPREELLRMVRTAFNGQPYLSSEVAAILAGRVSKPNLTAREREVLRLMAGGHSNQEIGNALFIAEGTVKSHVNSILSKMSVTDRTQAVTQAIQRGLVHVE